MKLSHIFTVLFLFSCISIAYAASSTASGTAPNIYVAGTEYIKNLETSGPAVPGGRPIAGVTYTYTPHRICMQDPISGSCMWINAVPQNAHLCMTAPVPRCTAISAGTHATSVFDGIAINASAKKPKWYFGFTVNPGTSVNPVWQGRAISVTVNW